MTLKLETTYDGAANFHKEIFKNKLSETNCNSTLTALFALIVSEIDNKIGTSKKRPQHYLDQSNENTFFLSVSCKEDIKDIIGNMCTSKTCGPNSIPIKILKKCKNGLAKPLSDMNNISFSTGKFPNSNKK